MALTHRLATVGAIVLAGLVTGGTPAPAVPAHTGRPAAGGSLTAARRRRAERPREQRAERPREQRAERPREQRAERPREPQSVASVGIAHCTFRDASRGTYDYATGTFTPGRTLAVGIRYPARAVAGRTGPTAGETQGAAPAYAGAPYPTIFFAPGYDLTPGTYSELLDAWVRAGFVVVAPEFPDTDPAAVAAARTGDPEDDIVNQPADLAFLIRQTLLMTRTADDTCLVLHGLVDAGAIGVAGQSDGGDTVAALSYSHAPADASLDAAGLRIRAAAVLSGSELGAGPYFAIAGDPALLVVQSATDQCNPPQDSAVLYDAIVQADKWFLDIHDADHLPPYTGEDASAFADVARVTTGFFLLELTGRVTAGGLLGSAHSSLAVATLSTGAEAPAMASLGQESEACYLG
jgi:hypothetical protein